MIKRISALVLLAFLMATPLIAQKYKVKKDKVLKDKEEVASVTGEVGMIKSTDLTFSQNGEEVLHITQKNWDNKYAEFRGFLMYILDFPLLNEELHIKYNANLVSKKQVVKLLMAKNDLHFYKDGFKKEEIEKLKNSEVMTSIQEDTVKAYEIISKWNKQIKDHKRETDELFDTFYVRTVHDNPEDRPRHLPRKITHLIYRKIGNEDIARDYKDQGKNIYRLVGGVAYRKTEPGTTSTFMEKEDMEVFRYVTQEGDYMGETSQFFPLTFTDLTSVHSAEEFTYYMTGNVEEYKVAHDASWRQRLDLILAILEGRDMI